MPTKRGFPASQIPQGFWPPPSGRVVRPSFHARSTDAAVADPQHARIRRQTKLDDRRANERGRLRLFPTRATRNSDRCRSPPQNRCSAGMALGSLGPLRCRPGFDSTRTSASRGGFRFPDGKHSTSPRRQDARWRVYSPCSRSSKGRSFANVSAPVLDHARQQGKRLGRPPSAAFKAVQARKLHRQGISNSEIARQLQISRTSVRRLLAQKKS